MMMANIEIRKVEEQLNHRLLFSVQVSGDTDRMEFPVGIPDQGSPAANEAAVLASTLAFAEALKAAAQLRVDAGTHR
ncbi:hypothetical protein [Rhodoblastus sp.]|uniref:hypothetical protein n=1 Tax=Rhodoblastus sp. TaxID=1962975 RepID=UPI003F97EF2B